MWVFFFNFSIAKLSFIDVIKLIFCRTDTRRGKMSTKRWEKTKCQDLLTHSFPLEKSTGENDHSCIADDDIVVQRGSQVFWLWALPSSLPMWSPRMEWGGVRILGTPADTAPPALDQHLHSMPSRQRAAVRQSMGTPWVAWQLHPRTQGDNNLNRNFSK